MTQAIALKCIHGLLPETCSFCKNKLKDRSLQTQIEAKTIEKAAARGLLIGQKNQVPGTELKNPIREDHQNNHIKNKTNEDKCMDGNLLNPKTCKKCGETKERDTDFNKNPGCKDGHENQCKVCKAKKDKDRRNNKSQKKAEVETGKKPAEVKKEPKTTESILFQEIRKRFKEIEGLFVTLSVLGQGDQAKKEMELFTQRFV